MNRPALDKPLTRNTPSLRDALRSLPVSDLDEAFDERVLAALRVPCPWWMTAWAALRPVLVSAACSLCVTLGLITWSTRAPVGREPVSLSALRPSVTMASAPPVALGDLSRLGNRPPTRANLMSALLIEPNAIAATAPPPLPARKTPELPRWRRLSCAPSLLA